MKKTMAGFIDMGEEAREDRTFTVAGFEFPTSNLFTPECVKNSLMFRPQLRDVIICSYPKCDSNSIDVMVWKILYPNTTLPPINVESNRYLPSMEMDCTQIQQAKRPRLMKTYLPPHMISFYKGAKYIYIMRAPWEACTSYYRFLWLIDNFTEPFDEFLKAFLKGKLGYGCYFKHVTDWNKRLNENNVLILCHEHVKNNPRSALFSIAAFLGDGYLKRVLHRDDLVNDIFKTVNWENCKSLRKNLTAISFTKPTCTKKQMEDLLEVVSEKLQGTNVERLWSNLLKRHDRVVNNVDST